MTTSLLFTTLLFFINLLSIKLGGGNNQGGSDFFKIFTKWKGGNKLKSEEKN